MKAGDPEQLHCKDDGVFPNGKHPALLYRAALGDSGDRAKAFETMFAHNGWTNSWRNGVYDFHHYHSTAHEVLGVYAGSVKVQLGGPEGPVVEVKAGDVVVLPAGLSHKNVGQSADFRTVGAYPSGTNYDMMYGKKDERPEADRNIDRVPLPTTDPVSGPGGALPRLWGKP